MLTQEDFDSYSGTESFKKTIKSKITNSNYESLIETIDYESELLKLQAELVELQQWTAKHKKRVCVLFEGRDAAGKGGAIRRFTEHLNPRSMRVVALTKPTEIEKGQWYFRRYIKELPDPGELVFFDRSWYNRAVVEPVNGFCTKKEYEVFMGQVNQFEKMIIDSGIRVVKFYFSISKDEQSRRFEDIKSSPVKKWKFSKVDESALELWDDYTSYKARMFEETDTEIAPWIIIRANRKSRARVEVIEKLLELIPYNN